MKPINQLSLPIRTALFVLLGTILLLPILVGAGSTAGTAADAAARSVPTVRVGLSLAENGTAVFVSSAVSSSGFSIGRSDGQSFIPLFAIPTTGLALLPDCNANLQYADRTASGRPNSNGNRPAYQLCTNEWFSSYAAASSAAARYPDGFAAYVDGHYEVRYGAYHTAEEANAAAQHAGASVATPVSGGIAAVDTATGKTVFEFEGATLAIRSANGGAVSLNTTSSRHEYPGFFELTAARELNVINVLDLETYVQCVMSNEIGTNVSTETRRAFSVLARTVPLTAKHASANCHVCSTSCCQVYLGNYRRSSENDAIANSTRGEYVTYQGKPIYCLYHTSNGGASCSSVAAWGGDEIPYLKSVTLPETDGGAIEVWQYAFTQSELYTFLSSRNAFRDLQSGISSVTVEETDPYGSGYVTVLSVTDHLHNTINLSTSEQIRRVLRFESANFTVSYSMQASVLGADGSVQQTDVTGYLDADGTYHAFDSFDNLPIAGTKQTVCPDRILFDGMGSGHGVGFSAVGSEQLVAEGYSYRYILSFFFEGTEISRLS